MPKMRFSAEQIVVLLRQIEVLMSQGKTPAVACREAGISRQGGYGTILHKIVCRRADRRLFTGTFFFRNRPQLELIRRLALETLQHNETR
jgi:hypothetical protein